MDRDPRTGAAARATAVATAEAATATAVTATATVETHNIHHCGQDRPPRIRQDRQGKGSACSSLQLAGRPKERHKGSCMRCWNRQHRTGAAARVQARRRR